jgi:hypothetical protein
MTQALYAHMNNKRKKTILQSNSNKNSMVLAQKQSWKTSGTE